MQIKKLYSLCADSLEWTPIGVDAYWTEADSPDTVIKNLIYQFRLLYSIVCVVCKGWAVDGIDGCQEAGNALSRSEW